MFIVFEGPDHTGKTSLLQELFKELKKENYKVSFTREPGGTLLGEAIRDILKNPEFSDMSDQCEIMLFAASRAEHCKKINKLLDEQYTVISDRFVQSSYVYQGYLREKTPLVYNINHVATRGFKQDLVVFVTCDPEEAISRCEPNDRKELSLTKEDIYKIHEYYQIIYEEGIGNNEEWIVIDTTGKTVEESYRLLIEKLKPYMINFVKE